MTAALMRCGMQRHRDFLWMQVGAAQLVLDRSFQIARAGAVGVCIYAIVLRAPYNLKVVKHPIHSSNGHYTISQQHMSNLFTDYTCAVHAELSALAEVTHTHTKMHAYFVLYFVRLYCNYFLLESINLLVANCKTVVVRRLHYLNCCTASRLTGGVGQGRQGDTR
jgi:hypothetical protein